jgi:hypothetical protein
MQWTLQIMLGTIDVSSRVTGTPTIEADEGMARICEFKILPLVGPISLTGYVGQAVTIDFIQITPSAAPVRLFTGVVDTPEYDPRARTTTFRCTDDLQRVCKRLVFEQSHPRYFFKAVPNVVYSENVFGRKSTRSGWHVLQDAMATAAASYDLSPRLDPMYTPWHAKLVPDFVFDESRIVDKTVSITLATRQSIKNSFDVDFQYRFNRLHQRVSRYQWEHPGVCYELANGIGFPTKTMVGDAVTGAGWDALNIDFTEPPASGVFYCGDTGSYTSGASAWSCPPEIQKALAAKTDIYLSKRFARQVTDHYFLKVVSNASLKSLGDLPSKMNGTMDGTFDSQIWEENLRRAPNILPIDITASKYAFDRSLGGQPLYTPPVESTPVGRVPHGEYIYDKTDFPIVGRVDSDRAVQCLIQQAQVQILASHRQNFVDLTVPIEPALDRTHTVWVNTVQTQARGKVRQLVHSFDTSSGLALTKIRLSISRVDSIGLQDPTSDPVLPFQPPAPAPLPPGTLLNSLPNTFAGAHPPPDITTYGFISNFTGVNTNPVEFRVPTFEIPASDQMAVENVIQQTYEVAIPDELLIVLN